MGKRTSVDELDETMSGRWLVVTQGSQHEWDLDAMTYMRTPGAASKSGPFEMDGQRMKITRVDHWPKVGSVSLVWYDDPEIPDSLEHFRQSSTIVSITKMVEET